MRNALLILCLSFVTIIATAESRFGRPVVKVRDSKNYQFVKLDDVDYPTLTNPHYTVSCLVYRGTEHYYVEVTVTSSVADKLYRIR